MTPISKELSPDERRECQAAYLDEFILGQISGKEFVARLQEVVGFSQSEARSEWQAAKDHMKPAIYDLKTGGIVFVPFFGMFARARITSFYGSDTGAIVQLETGSERLPFSLFEMRAAQ